MMQQFHVWHFEGGPPRLMLWDINHGHCPFNGFYRVVKELPCA